MHLGSLMIIFRSLIWNIYALDQVARGLNGQMLITFVVDPYVVHSFQSRQTFQIVSILESEVLISPVVSKAKYRSVVYRRSSYTVPTTINSPR